MSKGCLRFKEEKEQQDEGQVEEVKSDPSSVNWGQPRLVLKLPITQTQMTPSNAFSPRIFRFLGTLG